MPTTGGTVTPPAGMYTYSNGSIISIQAIPNSGYQFNYWVVSSNYTPGHGELGNSVLTDASGTVIGVAPRAGVSGIDSITFTANPANITCCYGYTYTYTAIFSKVAAATSTPTMQPTASPSPTATPISTSGPNYTVWIIAGIIVIVIITVIVAAVMMRKKM